MDVIWLNRISAVTLVAILNSKIASLPRIRVAQVCTYWFDTSVRFVQIMKLDREVPTFLYPHAIGSVRSSKRSIATIQDSIISVASKKPMSVSAKSEANWPFSSQPVSPRICIGQVWTGLGTSWRTRLCRYLRGSRRRNWRPWVVWWSICCVKTETVTPLWQ